MSGLFWVLISRCLVVSDFIDKVETEKGWNAFPSFFI